jgi:hypothetical protein
LSTEFSEEYIASIFRVEKQSEQETSVRAGGKQKYGNGLVKNNVEVKMTVFWDVTSCRMVDT